MSFVFVIFLDWIERSTNFTSVTPAWASVSVEPSWAFTTSPYIESKLKETERERSVRTWSDNGKNFHRVEVFCVDTLQLCVDRLMGWWHWVMMAGFSALWLGWEGDLFPIPPRKHTYCTHRSSRWVFVDHNQSTHTLPTPHLFNHWLIKKKKKKTLCVCVCVWAGKRAPY